MENHQASVINILDEYFVMITNLVSSMKSQTLLEGEFNKQKILHKSQFYQKLPVKICVAQALFESNSN